MAWRFAVAFPTALDEAIQAVFGTQQPQNAGQTPGGQSGLGQARAQFDETLARRWTRSRACWLDLHNQWFTDEERTMIQAIYKGIEIEMEMHQQANDYWKCDYTVIKHPKRTITIHHGDEEFPSIELAREYALQAARFAIDQANGKKGTEVMLETNSVVAIYGTHAQAEEAVKQLQRSGFDMKKMSIVGKDYHTDENVVGYYNTGDRMKYWGKQGAFWGGLWGMLFGAFFIIPGLGPILVAGPLVAWIVGALEGAVVVGGLSALGAGLYSIGIPKDSVVQYEAALKADKFLLLAHGTMNEVAQARDILQTTNPLEIKTHSAEREQSSSVSAR